MSDLDTVAARVADLLTSRRETVAVVESSAGGLVAAALLAIPGASRYFIGGAVVYTAPARFALLGMTSEMMEAAGLRSSSEPYARLIAARARETMATSWGLAETGAAGPGGNSYGDPAGHSCLAVSGPGGEHALTLRTGHADRRANMDAFAVGALELLATALREAP